MFGTNLKFLRQSKGISRELMAELLGCKKSTIRDWEQNINEPRIKHIMQIKKLLKCTYDDLFEGVER